MYVRLVTLGEGMDDEPYRVDLPQYSAISSDENTLTTIISLPPRQSPPAIPKPGAPYWLMVEGRMTLVGMPEDMLIAWWQRLAQQYPGHFPPYQPGFPPPP